jgi:hypothetical protein
VKGCFRTVLYFVRRAVTFVVYQHNRVAFKNGGHDTEVKRAESTEGNSTEVKVLPWERRCNPGSLV